MKKILISFGTRPELIKCYPVIAEFRKRGLAEHLLIVNTGQHSDLISNQLNEFKIMPHYDLSGFKNNQTIIDLTSAILTKLEQALNLEKKSGTEISCVLTQGDTLSTYAVSLFCFLNRIAVCHIEAGLRTYNMHRPYPEEFFRRSIALMADLHFAPNYNNQNNLIAEGIDANKIVVCGNTIIDAIKQFQLKYREVDSAKGIKRVLVYLHRRELLNGNFEHVINSLEKFILVNNEIEFIWIKNHNPAALAMHNEIESRSISNLKFIDAVSFSEMIELYNSIDLIMSDSGGMQEEAAYLQIPFIIMRSETERPESVENNLGYTIDFSFESMCNAFSNLQLCSASENFEGYGDGTAANKIVNEVLNKFNLD